ncbi:uncharacterized protein BX664DRAFT_109567 [Halteromyces radiatus]|uniref:uncharacterized protein n=1 Tax=Halteromyces radiatus TaxID=101107 RepID=UPI00221FA9A0|nr:uncharacterized protein BX664DRAFT_109567 [Halteromyces radiatus]KAI8093537.1 hypothetical protein BX664DRAFT_109567 [Halteromyces radiatus]
MAQHSPTLLECHEWVMEHCSNLLNTTSDDPSDCLIAIDSTRIFINALQAPITVTLPLQKKLDKLTQVLQTNTNIAAVVQEIQSVCQTCKPWLHSISFVECKPLTGAVTSMYRLESPKVIPHLSAPDYTAMWPDFMNRNSGWFRQYFVGNPYVTLAGPIQRYDIISASSSKTTDTSEHHDQQDDDNSYAIVTVVQEKLKAKHTSPNTKNNRKCSSTTCSRTTTGIQYRLIIRTSKETKRHTLLETDVRNTLDSLETCGQGDRLEISSINQQKEKQKHRPLRSFSSAIIHHTTSSSSSSPGQRRCNNDDDDNDYSPIRNKGHYKRDYLNNTTCPSLQRLLCATLLSIYPHLDLRQFKALSAEATIMAGLEKELLRFDELGIPKNYKFGVLVVRDGQTLEENWFSNTGLSNDLEQFLNIIGRRITLQGYKGYAAGLDTKCGESGEYSYVTNWKENEIMFHVGPLMPYNPQDKQQVHRKRYIGNDIVCIVFMETNQPSLFDPGAIRSQFLHIFIVVHPEIVDDKQAWRVEIVCNKNVQEFGPPIPSPPLFFMENELREYLILKCK